jgi:hypothetical protein
VFSTFTLTLWFTTPSPLEPTHSIDFPPLNKEMFTSLSTPEWRFIQIEILMGKFDGPAQAIRHYTRRGLQAEGKFDEALRCG